MIEIFCEIPSILSCEKMKVENSRYTVAGISKKFFLVIHGSLPLSQYYILWEDLLGRWLGILF